MGVYKIETSPEEDERIKELKKIFGEKAASKVFKKILTLEFKIKN